jgi:hypothetical protein
VASRDVASDACQALGLGAIPSPGTGDGFGMSVGMGVDAVMGSDGAAGKAPRASQRLINLCNETPLVGPGEYCSTRHRVPFSLVQCRIWYRRSGIESRSTNQHYEFRKSHRATRRKSDLVLILE